MQSKEQALRSTGCGPQTSKQTEQLSLCVQFHALTPHTSVGSPATSSGLDKSEAETRMRLGPVQTPASGLRTPGGRPALASAALEHLSPAGPCRCPAGEGLGFSGLPIASVPSPTGLSLVWVTGGAGHALCSVTAPLFWGSRARPCSLPALPAWWPQSQGYHGLASGPLRAARVTHTPPGGP